jgi:hypothetical protein
MVTFGHVPLISRWRHSPTFSHFSMATFGHIPLISRWQCSATFLSVLDDKVRSCSSHFSMATFGHVLSFRWRHSPTFSHFSMATFGHVPLISRWQCSATFLSVLDDKVRPCSSHFSMATLGHVPLVSRPPLHLLLSLTS